MLNSYIDDKTAIGALTEDFGDCIVLRSGLSLATLPRSTAELIENN